MNEWRVKSTWMRGQQTCRLTIYFNKWTVSSDVSIQRHHWHTLPTHDVNDVVCVGWPQYRGLRPLLFSNSGVGSFTSHNNQISVSAVRRDLRFFRPYPRRLESLTVYRCHYKGSTFFSVIERPLVLVRPGFEPMTSRSADWRSPNWANQAAVFVCLVPARLLLLSIIAVLYHVNGYLQRAYLRWLFSIIMYHQSGP